MELVHSGPGDRNQKSEVNDDLIFTPTNRKRFQEMETDCLAVPLCSCDQISFQSKFRLSAFSLESLIYPRWRAFVTRASIITPLCHSC